MEGQILLVTRKSIRNVLSSGDAMEGGRHRVRLIVVFPAFAVYPSQFRMASIMKSSNTAVLDLKKNISNIIKLASVVQLSGSVRIEGLVTHRQDSHVPNPQI